MHTVGLRYSDYCSHEQVETMRLVVLPCSSSPLKCAVKRRVFSVGDNPTRQGIAPAGSNRSGGGGDEAVGAFDGKGRVWRLRELAGRNTAWSVRISHACERRAGPETSDAEADRASTAGRPPLRMQAWPGRQQGDERAHPQFRRGIGRRHVDQGNA